MPSSKPAIEIINAKNKSETLCIFPIKRYIIVVMKRADPTEKCRIAAIGFLFFISILYNLHKDSVLKGDYYLTSQKTIFSPMLSMHIFPGSFEKHLVV